MKKGIHYWALPPDMTLPQKLRFAKECGYDGVELALLPEGEFSPYCSPGQLREIRETAAGENIALPSITNTLSWTCSFTSNRREIREKAGAVLRQQIDIAAAIGATAVLALPGFVSMDFPTNALHPSAGTAAPAGYHPSDELIDYADAYGRAAEGIRQAAAYAADAGVTVCVENIWNNFLLSPLEMRDFLDEIGSPYVRAYFDVGNVRPCGVPEHWIRVLGERIERVHFKDHVRGARTLDGFVPLLAGETDFAAVMDALRGAGYDGWVTAEVNVNRQVPDYIAKITSQALDAIFQLGGETNGRMQ